MTDSEVVCTDRTPWRNEFSEAQSNAPVFSPPVSAVHKEEPGNGSDLAVDVLANCNRANVSGSQ